MTGDAVWQEFDAAPLPVTLRLTRGEALHLLDRLDGAGDADREIGKRLRRLLPRELVRAAEQAAAERREAAT
jgi:hypothetical protein